MLLLNFGCSLASKWLTCQLRKQNAEDRLETIMKNGYSIEDLRKEWEAEVEYESCPSTTRGALRQMEKNITHIASLFTLQTKYRRIVNTFNKQIAHTRRQSLNPRQAADIQKAKDKLYEVDQELKKWRKTLGVGSRASAVSIVEGEWSHLCLEALVLKHQLRDMLRRCKQELARTERAHTVAKNPANRSSKHLIFLC
jgi:hypothetical protein